MNIRGTLAIVVGLMQSVTAALVLIFACCLFFNLSGVQGQLNEVVHSHFHVLVLVVFGLSSIVSGSFLVYEWLESR